MDKAVILARGLGTRMRQNSTGAGLTPGQAAVAGAGMKAMIPMGNRPFLDHLLTALADAGFREVCLVIGQEHVILRRYYSSVPCRRLRIHHAIQDMPLGTADAVSAALEFTGNDPFLVLNGDNYYPVEAFRALRDLGEPGLAAFNRDTLVAESNIPPGRIARFAIVESDAEGYLSRITEKPDPDTIAALSGPVWVSMNCWRFDRRIHPSAHAIEASPRGELELPDAIRHAMKQQSMKFRVVEAEGGVLDLTSVDDVAEVTARLKNRPVNL